MTKIIEQVQEKNRKLLSKIKKLFHRHKYEETTIPRIVSGIEHTFGGARYYQDSYKELVRICKCGKKLTKRLK